MITLCNIADVSAASLARQVAEILEKRFSPAQVPQVTPTAGGPPNWLTGSERLYWSPETDRIFSIAARRGALEYVEDNEKVELVPTSADHWQSRDRSFTIALRGAANEIEISSTGGDPVAFQPVDRWSPTLSELAPYAGSYWCRELESTYTIRITGGRAELVTRYGRTDRLDPVFPRAFRSDLAGLIRFSRGGDRASGFEVLSGRTRLFFRLQGAASP